LSTFVLGNETHETEACVNLSLWLKHMKRE